MHHTHQSEPKVLCYLPRVTRKIQGMGIFLEESVFLEECGECQSSHGFIHTVFQSRPYLWNHKDYLGKN